MCHRDMLIQHLTHMPNQLIHRKIRLIYVIVCIISILFIFYQEPDKRHDIPYVCHRLPVIPLPHHQKLPAGNLFQ